MILENVSFGIYAFMPQGWLFMISIIILESIIFGRMLQLDLNSFSVYLKIGLSNLVSGIVGIVISMILSGGWWLVVWFPWVGDNEVRDSQMSLLAIVYGIAFLQTLLIELPANAILFRKPGPKKTLVPTLTANVISYLLGSILLYTYSFGI